jgi:peroxiredoxin
LTFVIAALGALLLGAFWAIYQLIVQQGRLLLQFQTLERKLCEQGIATGSTVESSRGLRPGSLLNNFELALLAGGTMTLFEHRGRKLLLIFFDPACSHCQAMLPDLARLQSITKPDLPLPLIISTGTAEENRRLFADHDVRCPVLLQERMEVAELYLVSGTPMGYLLDTRLATIGNLLVGSQSLLAAARGSNMAPDVGLEATVESRNGRAYTPSRSVATSQLQRDGLEAGSRAPVFTLPQVNGSMLSLDAFRGQKVLLVFSDPACGPCNQLAPKLERVHRRRGDLRVLMISRGDNEANRRKVAEHGITFPLVLQRHWEISRAYGTFATPIGYLINEEGVLASNVLVGPEAILKAASRKSVRSHGLVPSFAERSADIMRRRSKEFRHILIRIHLAQEEHRRRIS